MRNIWLILKHDVKTMLEERSFWIFTLIVPLLMLAVSFSRSTGGSGGDADTESGEAEAQEQNAASPDLPAIGLVDEANLVASMPPGFPADLFVRFKNNDAAIAALKQGQVRQVVAIPADYMARGKVIVYDQDYKILRSGENMGLGYGSGSEWMLPYLINYNLTGDAELTAALRNPTPGELARMHRLAPLAIEQENSQVVDLVSSYLPYIFYFLLIMSGNYLMRSVIAEKENRTAEVLLLSVQPRQLMAGKIIAGSVIMIIQLIIWALAGILIYSRTFSNIDLSSFQFPPGFFIWAVVYLVFGYLLFASVMAAGGALANNPREVGQITILLIIPLMPTLMFGPYFIEQPDSLLTIGLSLFPFSSPSVMVTRLAFGPVPTWQLLASLAMLAGTAYLFLVLAGRFFHTGNLLSEESFRWSRMLSGLKRQ